jgi:hypothetical protein
MFPRNVSCRIPFQSCLLTRVLALSPNEIRRQLAEEEHRRVEEGSLIVDGSPLSFILMGLSIADTQCVPKSLSINAFLTII